MALLFFFVRSSKFNIYDALGVFFREKVYYSIFFRTNTCSFGNHGNKFERCDVFYGLFEEK